MVTITALSLKVEFLVIRSLTRSVPLKIGKIFHIRSLFADFLSSVQKQAKNSSTTLYLIETLNGVPADVASTDIQNWYFDCSFDTGPFV